MIKRLICLLKAIPFWLKCGAWAPHSYGKAEYEKAIIITTDTGYRISSNYEHKEGETVYKDACLIKCRCQKCGHEEISWYRSWEERWKLD